MLLNLFKKILILLSLIFPFLVSGSDQSWEVTHYPNKFYNVKYSEKGEIITKHIFDNRGNLIATIEGSGEDAKTRYIHTDHLSSTNVVTDEAGQIVETNDYYPFGEVKIKNGSFENQRKYIGQMFDHESNLNYLNYRYYDNRRGQFLSQDPVFWSQNIPVEVLLDPQQQNSYSYARNNPINRSDPTGQLSKKVLKDLTGRLSNFINRFSGYLKSIGIFSNSSAPSPIASTKTDSGAQKSTTWDPVTDQRIGELDPRVRQPATNFINNTESELGIKLRVTTGYRSVDEQNELFSQGRTKPGPVVTKASGGLSYHQYGRAIDVVVMENGKPKWNPITDEIAREGEAEGFLWGGRWKDFPDYPHFEMSFGKSVFDLYDKYLNSR